MKLCQHMAIDLRGEIRIISTSMKFQLNVYEENRKASNIKATPIWFPKGNVIVNNTTQNDKNESTSIHWK